MDSVFIRRASVNMALEYMPMDLNSHMDLVNYSHKYPISREPIKKKVIMPLSVIHGFCTFYK